MIQDYYTKIKSSDDFVILAHLLLQDEGDKDVLIRKAFSSDLNKGKVTRFPVERLNLDRIYSKNQIRTLCLSNHLKFSHASDSNISLSSNVVSEIKDLEKRYSVNIQSYYVLINHDEKMAYQMLFCRLPNDCYFVLDESKVKSKKLKALSLRSTASFLSTLLLPSLLAGLICMTLPWLMQLVVFTVVLAVTGTFLFKNNWHRQITSKTWWLV